MLGGRVGGGAGLLIRDPVKAVCSVLSEGSSQGACAVWPQRWGLSFVLSAAQRQGEGRRAGLQGLCFLMSVLKTPTPQEPTPVTPLPHRHPLPLPPPPFYFLMTRALCTI